MYAVAAVSLIATLTVPPTDMTVVEGAPLRLHIDASAETPVSLRVYGGGADVTAYEITYGGRGNALQVRGCAELTLRGAAGIVSVRTDGEPIYVTVTDANGRLTPLSASGRALLMVRTPDGIALTEIDDA